MSHVKNFLRYKYSDAKPSSKVGFRVEEGQAAAVIRFSYLAGSECDCVLRVTRAGRLLLVQGNIALSSTKMFVNLVKQDPGRARQSS